MNVNGKKKQRNQNKQIVAWFLNILNSIHFFLFSIGLVFFFSLRMVMELLRLLLQIFSFCIYLHLQNIIQVFFCIFVIFFLFCFYYWLINNVVEKWKTNILEMKSLIMYELILHVYRFLRSNYNDLIIMQNQRIF